MKFLILILVCVVLFVTQYEAKPFTLRKFGELEKEKVDPETLQAFRDLVKDFFAKKLDKEKIKKCMMHIAKAFGDAEIYETWYSIPKEDRICMENAQNYLVELMLQGELSVTPDQFVKILCEKCPNSAAGLERIYQLQVEKMKLLIKQVMEEVKQMPPAFQDLADKFYDIVKCFGRFPPDQEKCRQAMLAFFKALLNIPPAELEQMAKLCPDLAPILGGDLEKPAVEIIKCIIEYLRTGDRDVFHTKDFFRVVGKFIPYLKQKIRWIMKEIKAAPEQDFPDFVVQGISEDLDRCLAKWDPAFGIGSDGKRPVLEGNVKDEIPIGGGNERDG